MNLYDAHCHLNEEHIFSRREECLARFVDAGGRGMVNVGASEAYNRNGIEIARVAGRGSRYEEKIIVKASLGLHPECVGTEITKENLEIKLQRLKAMIGENREHVVAVGECGIDLHFINTEENLAVQKKLFVAQCELARELNLPLIIHSRDAFDQTMDVLKDYLDLVVYFHCWGYGPEEIKRLRDEGIKKLYIGFCGNVTYKKAEALRESLKFVPLDSLLLETDAPYLAPQVVRGQENEPTNVKLIYEFVSQYLGIEIKELAQMCEKNFNKLYLK